jgi:hypothetical protein
MINAETDCIDGKKATVSVWAPGKVEIGKGSMFDVFKSRRGSGTLVDRLPGLVETALVGLMTIDGNHVKAGGAEGDVSGFSHSVTFRGMGGLQQSCVECCSGCTPIDHEWGSRRVAGEEEKPCVKF